MVVKIQKTILQYHIIKKQMIFDDKAGNREVKNIKIHMTEKSKNI